MESPVGHVVPGLFFLLIGLWHLFNNIKLFYLNPNTFSSSPWFSFSKLRCLELYTIIVSLPCLIVRLLFIGPKRHHPFEPDGTIASSHLRSFEHAGMSISFIVYAVFAIVFDRSRHRAAATAKGLAFLALAAAFAQQLFLFHLHSVDNMSMEGQYHLLLQLVIFISLITTLMGIAMPNIYFFGELCKIIKCSLSRNMVNSHGFHAFHTKFDP